MKKGFDKIKKVVRFESSSAGHELFIFVGVLMVVGTLLKLTGVFYLDSDWYWFLAGLGLTIEGVVSFVKHKRFNKKYRILSKEEFEKLSGEKG